MIDVSGLSYNFESLGGKRTGADIIVDEGEGAIVVFRNGNKLRTVVLKVLDSKEFQRFENVMQHLLKGISSGSVHVTKRAEELIKAQALKNLNRHGGALSASLREQSISFRT